MFCLAGILTYAATNSLPLKKDFPSISSLANGSQNDGGPGYTYLLKNITVSCSGGSNCLDGKVSVSAGDNSYDACGTAEAAAITANCVACGSNDCTRCGIGCPNQLNCDPNKQCSYCQCSLFPQEKSQVVKFSDEDAFIELTYTLQRTGGNNSVIGKDGKAVIVTVKIQNNENGLVKNRGLSASYVTSKNMPDGVIFKLSPNIDNNGFSLICLDVENN